MILLIVEDRQRLNIAISNLPGAFERTFFHTRKTIANLHVNRSGTAADVGEITQALRPVT